MTLTNVTVSGNTAGNKGSGAGIYKGGTLDITKSIISDNSAVAGSTNNVGGGIYNDPRGTLTLIDSIVSGNTAKRNGAGIYSTGALTMTGGTVSDNNTTLGDGGGIYIDSGARRP